MHLTVSRAQLRPKLICAPMAGNSSPIDKLQVDGKSPNPQNLCQDLQV